MKTQILATALTLAATQLLADAHVDQTDPNATAIAVIEALRAQDGPAVAALFNETNQRSVPTFEAMAPGDPEWGEIWSEWRQAGLEVWGGKNLPARDRDGDGLTAIVPFAFDGPDGAVSLMDPCTGGCRYLTIVLTRGGAADPTWGFEDINGTQVPAYVNAGPLN